MKGITYFSPIETAMDKDARLRREVQTAEDREARRQEHPAWPRNFVSKPFVPTATSPVTAAQDECDRAAQLAQPFRERTNFHD